MYDFPVVVTQAKSHAGVWVVCPDVPELNSSGDTDEEALEQARDGLIRSLSLYIDNRRPIPVPSEPEPGQPVIHLPALVAAKVALWNAMQGRGMRKADLARLLGCSQAQVDRMLDLTHSSKLERIEYALRLLGKRLGVVVADKEFNKG
ncbi:type II toxin-antitoxin system HicB family antitoxin [Microbulbifer sp. THAF38]|uniref:type II toxin-antitoxin system HicB family antitoxin n=1 Tax=Microbulbifer sp. THAF38 TaxID=2587856 RepID=UPI001268FB50|nr:type II toxin-antitoxin system HicB family antitoxin [Microbulbifer sp. THAF38]QFT56478.1 Antitoxin HicB [Microbulbifer sp. THAF38]